MSDVRERHVRYAADPAFRRTDDDPEWCADCDVPWPCDAIQMADERDAARADADRLAELVLLWRSIAACREYPPSVEVQEQTRDALRQHEGATR